MFRRISLSAIVAAATIFSTVLITADTAEARRWRRRSLFRAPAARFYNRPVRGVRLGVGRVPYYGGYRGYAYSPYRSFYRGGVVFGGVRVAAPGVGVAIGF